MVLHQHGTVLLYGIALAFFLSELTDIDLGDIALNRSRDELLTVLVALFCLRHRAGRGQRARQCDGQYCGFCDHSSVGFHCSRISKASTMRTTCGCSCSYCGSGNTSPPSTDP